jgi:hypothetical protein
MKKAFLILITILTFTSCKKSNETSKIVGADWLLGKWENNSKYGNLSETWKKVNDSLYNGESYFIKGKDTLHVEQIQLEQKGENLFYISTIIGQNNDKPVTYKHNTTVENQLVFENPNNEYPRKIGYSQITKDSIVIVITGIQQKKPSTEKYGMKKTK